MSDDHLISKVLPLVDLCLVAASRSWASLTKVRLPTNLEDELAMFVEYEVWKYKIKYYYRIADRNRFMHFLFMNHREMFDRLNHIDRITPTGTIRKAVFYVYGAIEINLTENVFLSEPESSIWRVDDIIVYWGDHIIDMKSHIIYRVRSLRSDLCHNTIVMSNGYERHLACDFNILDDYPPKYLTREELIKCLSDGLLTKSRVFVKN
jgi:hypothetical protein